jgi:hypothetical protein
MLSDSHVLRTAAYDAVRTVLRVSLDDEEGSAHVASEGELEDIRSEVLAVYIWLTPSFSCLEDTSFHKQRLALAASDVKRHFKFYFRLAKVLPILRLF